MAQQDPAILTENLFQVPNWTAITPGSAEKRFTEYEEVAGFLKNYRGNSRVTIDSIGNSEQGREIWKAHFKGANNGNPVRIMVIARVHGNEPAGTEGALQAIHELAQGELTGLLDKIEVVVVPVSNPDGASVDRRRTSSEIDINRDYVLSNGVETRAILAEVNAFDPHIFIDMHEFTVWGRLGPKSIPYDMLTASANEPNIDPRLTALSTGLYQGNIERQLEAHGLRHSEYRIINEGGKGIKVKESGTSFGSAKNFMGMPGRISLLFEGRGIGLKEQNLERRTYAQYLALQAVLQTAHENADKTLALINDSRAYNRALSVWQLERKGIYQKSSYRLANGETGRIETFEVDFVNRRDGKPVFEEQVPRYYIIPSSQRRVIETLERIGVGYQRLKQDVTLEVEVQTGSNFKQAGKVYQNIHRYTFDVSLDKQQRTFAAGDVVVDTRQSAKLMAMTLEARSRGSFAVFGMFGQNEGLEVPIYRYHGDSLL
ncbi:M14 family zinc carboxypeptidase [Marinobacterium arenosum]|uniref:M14 family zinc carboxypeptidase n=1 Tax=Marinobacterium arenosum TaxID=2862496 RepID=UPI001C95C4F9|nr:M14 family zinc carboxypeptidase [Marinobacterium arenosum]MBY4677094.1 succinylglutamate desuccinylase/aspartoacylase family protein [Marinobacterium arenosum]